MRVVVAIVLVAGLLAVPLEGAAQEEERELIAVGYHPPAGAMLEEVAADLGLRVQRRIPQLDALVFEAPGRTAPRIAHQLAALPGVRHAQVDPRVWATERTPGDPLWQQQWGARHIRAPLAWDTTVGVEETVVAVLDTGVDRDHEDLRDGMTGGVNLVDPGQPPLDHHGHGTMSSGVIAARSDNGTGIAGLCWECKIMPVKVLDDLGGGPSSTVAAGIVWAADNGASVVNLSLGGPDESQIMADAITYAQARDVVMVASAGNANTRTPFFPAADERVIGVAGSTADDERYDWSNFGDWVDVTAPGCNPAPSLADRYAWYCGTSSAAPAVSGVVGLLRSMDASIDARTIRELVITTSRPAEFVRYGRVDAAGAVTGAGTIEPVDSPAEQGSVFDPVTAPEPIPDESEPEPDSGTTVQRRSGTDRFATTAAISTAAFDPGVARVYVATSANFPDALAAGAAAARFDSPVLISARDELPAPIAAELSRLEPDEVVVVGGTSAVSDTTAQKIANAAAAPTRRVAGPDRYATAAAIALDAMDRASTVYIATGAAFPDALAGVPAAARDSAPILLTSRDSLPSATTDALGALRPDRIVVLGGTAAVGEPVVERLRAMAEQVERRGGSDRFATAAAIAQGFPEGLPVAYLATGFDFPDALAGGPAVATAGGVMLLATPDLLPEATAAQLRRIGPSRIVVLGGQAAISDPVAYEAARVAAEPRPE